MNSVAGDTVERSTTDFLKRCHDLTHVQELFDVSEVPCAERPVSDVDVQKFREGARRAATWFAETFCPPQ